ncbi:MAG: CBS domain-containing protein, partial [Rhodoferax sp.]|nr:CBS domain-containing protein [Rhodoferax sp.]
RSADQVPRVHLNAGFGEIMREMSNKGLGATAVIDDAGGLCGIFTDGDLRRLIEKGVDLRSASAAQVMHANPGTIGVDALAVDAVELMEQRRITSVLVLDGAGQLVGALNSNDLMRAKVI